MSKTFWMLMGIFAVVLIVSFGMLDFSEQRVRDQMATQEVESLSDISAERASLGEVHSFHSELPILGRAPKFSFANFEGKVITEKDVQGEPWVVSFFFTSCPHVCPTVNGRISNLSKRFENAGVRFVSVSVDPETDTPTALRDYALKYGANPNRWHMLRGDLADVFTFMRDGLKLGSGKLPDIHTTRVGLIDSEGQIRGYYHGLDSRSMAKLGDDIDSLLR